LTGKIFAKMDDKNWLVRVNCQFIGQFTLC